MEFEEFLENLEYTNACMLGKYRLTIDKQLIFQIIHSFSFPPGRIVCHIQ